MRSGQDPPQQVVTTHTASDVVKVMWKASEKAMKRLWAQGDADEGDVLSHRFRAGRLGPRSLFLLFEGNMAIASLLNPAQSLGIHATA